MGGQLLSNQYAATGNEWYNQIERKEKYRHFFAFSEIMFNFAVENIVLILYEYAEYDTTDSRVFQDTTCLEGLAVRFICSWRGNRA